MEDFFGRNIQNPAEMKTVIIHNEGGGLQFF